MYTVVYMGKPKHAPVLLYALEKAGGMSALANKIGISRQAISKWRRIPAERVLAVEVATGISRHDLREDVYPRESVQ